MHVVACLDPFPLLIDPAHRRGIMLLPIAQARHVPVRLARWQPRDGCVRVHLDTVRAGLAAARAMLLVEDGDASAAALDAGADDVATTAASPVEIVARLSALLRTVPGNNCVTIGDLTIDRDARTVRRSGVTLDLLPREYAVLLRLADHAGHPVARDTLLREIWARDFDPGTNVVQVQISRLRAKLDAAGPPILHTDRGRGYRLGDAGEPWDGISAARFR